MRWTACFLSTLNLTLETLPTDKSRAGSQESDIVFHATYLLYKGMKIGHKESA